MFEKVQNFHWKLGKIEKSCLPVEIFHCFFGKKFWPPFQHRGGGRSHPTVSSHASTFPPPRHAHSIPPGGLPMPMYASWFFCIFWCIPKIPLVCERSLTLSLNVNLSNIHRQKFTAIISFVSPFSSRSLSFLADFQFHFYNFKIKQ